MKKPTDLRREINGEPGLTHEAAARILAEKGTRLHSTERVKGGLRYHVTIRRVPRTLKINSMEDNNAR